MRVVGLVNNWVSFANVEGDDEVELANDGGTAKKKRTPTDKLHITCHKCHKKRHYTNECTNASGDDEADEEPNRQSEATMLLAGIADGEFSGNSSFQFLQHSEGTVFYGSRNDGVPDHWILLNNQSTVDVFHNKKLLSNIWKSDSVMKIHCNAGVTATNLVGDL
jgi:hypothetical protein